MTDYRVLWTRCGRCGKLFECCLDERNVARCAICATLQRDEARALLEEALDWLQRIHAEDVRDELRKRARWLGKEATE